MYVTSEQVRAAGKANVEAILSLASAHFAAIEKFANLNANAFKVAFEESIANARALANANNVQEILNLQRSFAQPAVEKAIANAKSVYKVASETNAELSRAAERRASVWKEQFVSLLDHAARHAPAGSDVAVSAVKQMIAAANAAYDNFNKAAKQATSIAEANVAAATKTEKGLAKAKKGRLSAKQGKFRSSTKRRPIEKAAPRRKKK